MSFERAQTIADAVLYEGYVLYPYRASAVKNQVRWQFGVAAPRAFSEAGGGEPWAMQTECLVEPLAAPQLDLRVRFLQVQARTVEEAAPEHEFRAVPSLELEGREWLAWEEGVERQLDVAGISLLGALAAERVARLELPGGSEVELLRDAAGTVRGRLVRRRWPISGAVRVSASRVGGLLKLRVRVENLGSCGRGAERALALRRSLISLHAVLVVRGGVFVSLLDPPAHARAAAASCENLHTWPVLVGPEGRSDVMLSSPIILYDYPAVAPESPGDLCDATEIDEILTLRVLTLTDEEKRAARATDERARRIIDRSETLSPEELQRLHGALRRPRPSVAEAPAEDAWASFLNPESAAPPESAWVQVGAERVSRGSRVRLTPRRRADSMDLFLASRAARVEGVFRDVDDQAYVAVSVEDDPAAELHGWYGRFFYFYPDEIEPLQSATDVQRRA